MTYRIFTENIFKMETAIEKVSKAIYELMIEKINEYVDVFLAESQYKNLILSELERQISWMAEDLELSKRNLKRIISNNMKIRKHEQKTRSSLSVEAKPFVPLFIEDVTPEEPMSFDMSYLDNLLKIDE